MLYIWRGSDLGSTASSGQLVPQNFSGLITNDLLLINLDARALTLFSPKRIFHQYGTKTNMGKLVPSAALDCFVSSVLSILWKMF